MPYVLQGFPHWMVRMQPTSSTRWAPEIILPAPLIVLSPALVFLHVCFDWYKDLRENSLLSPECVLLLSFFVSFYVSLSFCLSLCISFLSDNSCPQILAALISNFWVWLLSSRKLLTLWTLFPSDKSWKTLARQ